MADDAKDRARRRVEELGRRYVDMVYQAAVRQMGGEGRGAEDVTQAVFLMATERGKPIWREHYQAKTVIANDVALAGNYRIVFPAGVGVVELVNGREVPVTQK